MPSANTEMTSPNLRHTNLPGVMSHIAPPRSFNPVLASDSELASYGFPPRPDQVAQPKAYASWKKAVDMNNVRVFAPVEQTKIYHKPNQGSKAKAQAQAQTGSPSNISYSTNWSGFVKTNGVTSYNNTSSYYFLFADYVVPAARQAYGACTGGWDYSSSWVGIDGYGSPDVLQAGTESDAYCLNLLGSQYTSTYYSAWYEWYPYSEVRINNSSFPVRAGDDLFVEVWDTSATVGHAYIVNYQTNKAVEYTFSAPPGTTLRGNSAEWIVEAPSVGGGQAALTNYVMDFFSNSYAYPFSGAGVYPGISTQVDMIDSHGYVISYPTLLGSSGIWFQTANSARYAGSL
jgi:hypothetical protein